jgi:hypothetical protein
MSLESTIKEIKSLKPFAEENPDLGPVETLTGRRGRKNQAIARLEQLRGQYLDELKTSAIFIITCGTKRSEFETIATSEKFGLFSTDPEFFYKDLASRVSPTLYSRAGQSDIFDVLGRHLEDKMGELGLAEYNQMVFREKYIQSIANVEELTQVLKVAINEQIGSEIVGIQSLNLILDKAISSEYISKTTPIVLNTQDEKLALSLLTDLERLTKRIFLVNVGKVSKDLRGIEDSINLKDATEETVEATLAQINKNLKR